MIIRNPIGCFSVLLCCFLFSACENDGDGGDTADYATPGWTVSDFHTLCTITEPIVCTPTRAIEFDSLGNLYIENTMDDESGFIDILKLDVSSGFSTLPSYFATYSTTYKGATGLDFDGLGSLYVSERSVGGDAGIIREIDVASKIRLLLNEKGEVKIESSPLDSMLGHTVGLALKGCDTQTPFYFYCFISHFRDLRVMGDKDDSSPVLSVNLVQ